MNRAKVIGPSRRISARIASSSSGSDGDVRRRSAGRASGPSTRPAGRATSRSPGPTSVWPPRSDRDRRVAARTRSAPAATDRRSARGAAGRSRTGPPALGQLRSSAPNRWASSTRRVDERRVGRARPAARRGPRARRGRAAAPRLERTGRCSGGARPEAALLDRAPGSARRSTAPARRGRGRSRDRRRGARARVDGHGRGRRPSADRTRGRRRCPRRASASLGPASAGRVERRVEIDLEPPASAQVADLDAGAASSQRGSPLSAARSGSVRERPGARRPRRRRPSSGCSRGPWPAGPAAAATNAARSACRRERDRCPSRG